MRAHLLSVWPAHRNDETPRQRSPGLDLPRDGGHGKIRAMNALAETYRFSVEEYNKLGEAGIFHGGDRVELLNGEIIVMAPIGKRHITAVRRLARKFQLAFHDVCYVDCQSPFILDDFSEPQPDILLLKPEIDQTGEIPRPADLFVAIEVADSSVRYDSTLKLAAYAQARIAE
jgi:Uma2 family endonuclease